MATSIFFTESKDFKLIKDRILNHEDDYLVYVYADTSNVRIPKELIMELPRYGNNLIWVDTADMDSSDLSHHIVLTIGQLINPEEEIEFYIVSKSSKLDKTIIFLRNQGIPAEMIAPSQGLIKPEKNAGTGRRGRPKKVKTDEIKPVKAGKRGRPKKEKAVLEVVEAPVKTGKRGRPKKEKPVPEVVENQAKTAKRGRPKKIKTEVPVSEPVIAAPKKKRGRPAAVKAVVTEAVPAEPKKRGRKKIEKPVAEGIEAKEVKPKKSSKKASKKEKPVRKKASAKVKKAKAEKPANTRINKEITVEMVQEKLDKFSTGDSNISIVLSKLFGMKKVARPKFEAKLVKLIKEDTLEDDTVAERILNQLKDLQVLETVNGRIVYKD
jgi:hypothetical protein